MSLIVAQIIGSSVCILSDMRITPKSHSGTYRRPFDGALKTILLSPSLSVSYAGNNREAAYDAIAEFCFADERSIVSVELAEHLLQVHRDNPNTEFIVSKLNPSKLYWIHDGSLNQDLPAVWIGDSVAFNVCQESFSAWKPTFSRLDIGDAEHSEFLEVCDRMTSAFETVLERDSLCELVGGPLIRLASTSIGFEYMTASYGHNFGPVSGTTIETNAMKIEVGKTYTYSILVSKAPGIGAVGIYIDQLNAGGLFFPRKSEGVIRFDDCSVSEFINRVEMQYGIRLNGLMWSLG